MSNDLRQILTAARSAIARNKSGVLATVVSVKGSSYRKPGARMVIQSDGSSEGFISGACLHNDLFEHAKLAIAENRPKLISYDTTSPDDIVFGLALGCGGVVQILLEPLLLPATRSKVDFLLKATEAEGTSALATLFSSQADAPGSFIGVSGELQTGKIDSPELAQALFCALTESQRNGATTSQRFDVGKSQAEALIEAVAAPSDLLVFGATPNVEPLVRFAHELGWSVTVADHRPAYVVPDRFPHAQQVLHATPETLLQKIRVGSNTSVVIMTHNFPTDLALVKLFMPSQVRYIGMLGSRGKRDMLLSQLDTDGFVMTPEYLVKLHSPVGLDIGSETPAEIALSVIAEIVKETRKK